MKNTALSRLWYGMPPSCRSILPTTMSMTCPKLGFLLLAILACTTGWANELCQAPSPTPASEWSAPLTEGFAIPGQALPGGFDRAQSVDRVLHRRQLERCRLAIAVALTPVAASAYEVDYAKQTEFDNTPYRFNMTQDGKRMSADDFDAWLKSNGYSVGRRVSPDKAQDK